MASFRPSTHSEFMNDTKRAYLELHIAVALFGFTAILGDLIQLSALMIVWWRVLLTSASLLFIIKVGDMFRRLPRRLGGWFVVIGWLVALHWVSFYGAIKLANASIALICLATTSFFTAFLEPIIMRQSFKWYEMLLGVLIIPGMWLIFSGTEAGMNQGIFVGLFSALMAALFATLNKRFTGRMKETEVTFLELGSSWLLLTVVLPFYFGYADGNLVFWPGTTDWLYLLLLALLCTTLAYVLALRALRYLSAFASNLTINLEPVYGIALAWVLLNDHQELAPTFYWGVLLVLSAIFSYPVVKKRFEQKK